MSMFDGINWELFRAQKRLLVELTCRLPGEDSDLIEGLINFLDHYMDCAAEELGSDIVFGDDE